VLNIADKNLQLVPQVRQDIGLYFSFFFKGLVYKRNFFLLGFISFKNTQAKLIVLRQSNRKIKQKGDHVKPSASRYPAELFEERDFNP